MNELAIYVLSVNAVWDYLSFLGMLFMLLTGRGNWLAYAHFGMWSSHEDQDNRVIMLLFSVLVLNFGFLRTLAVVWNVEALATWSYLLEGVLVFIATTKGWMEQMGGWVVVVLCTVCYAVVVSN
jgi:hypothetical protein